MQNGTGAYSTDALYFEQNVLPPLVVDKKGAHPQAREQQSKITLGC
jgi:hypothetical protein